MFVRLPRAWPLLAVCCASSLIISAPGVAQTAAIEKSGLTLAVIFITHDLEEAIALGDRVVVMPAGPASHPVGEYLIDLPRPRDVEEIRMTPRFVELQRRIWHALRAEVHPRPRWASA